MFLDVGTPEWVRSYLWVDIGIEFPAEEIPVARGQLLELLCKFIGLENSKIRQTDLV